eukprot:m.91968 g.91968  ORF g.91968 m.91968 type:complete len:407 (+) comp20213_c0_seq2:398-1618(+)
MAFISALMADSGLPLFTRTSSGLESLSYSAMGSLFGIKTYVEDQQVIIVGARTSTAAVRWKVVPESKLLLVIVTDNDYSTDDYINELLELVCSAIVFTLGATKLAQLSSGAEELYRLELKKCYPLIDSLISSLRSVASAGPALQCVDRAVIPSDTAISAALDRFVYSASAKWGFLLVNGQVLVADANWWSLRADEKILLAALPPNLGELAEKAIYLPHASPSVPFRLVSAAIAPGVHACLLCGADPPLEAIKDQLLKPVWGGLLDPLRRLQSKPAVYPPGALQLTDGVVGMLLVDPAANWSMFFHSAAEGVVAKGTTPKLAVCAYYKSMIGPSVMKKSPAGALEHKVTESYSVTTRYKLYYMEQRTVDGVPIRVIGLFAPGVPTYSLRHLTATTFSDLEACNVFSC